MANKILLTGASGFVGRHVIQALTEYELHAISTRSQPIEGIEQQFTWDQLDTIEDQYQAVIHMAGLAHDTSNTHAEQAYFDVNKGLTEKLMAHCTRWNIKSFIYLSSVKAAVDSMSDQVLTEELNLEPSEIYGRSKRAAENVILEDQQDFRKIVLRPVMIYGKGQKGNLSTLEKIIRKGIPVPLKNWHNRRSVLGVKNLTKCIRWSIEKNINSDVYYIADDGAYSTADLITNIGNGIGINPRFIPMPGGLIKLVTNLLPAKYRKITNKVLGNLEVDNTKLKKALNLDQMPISTAAGFKDIYST